MRHAPRSVFSLIAGLTLVQPSILPAAVPPVLLAEPGRLRDGDLMVGYRFSVTRDITLSALGKLDANGNGRLDDVLAPQIGVWDADDALIASTTIDLGALPDHGGFFGTIPPTRLQPGDYVIGVQAFAGQEPFDIDAQISTSGAIDWVEARRGRTSEFGLPGQRSGATAFFGPSFLIEEPVALFGPSERAVFQRDANGVARVPLSGLVGADVDRVEARALVMPGFTGRNTEWQTIGTANGQLVGDLELPAGGWYRIETRGYRGEEVLPGDTLERIGAGEVFVTAGQSNSANHGNPPQQTSSDLVSAMAANGVWQTANDPQPIATGGGGSPWPILGDLLVERLGVPVGFVSVGWGGTTVGQWLPGASGPDAEPLYDRLRDALQALGPNGARAVLWHQGESDALVATPAGVYAERLEELIESSRRDAQFDIEWGIALASFLPANSEASEQEILAGQLDVITADAFTFQGPETDDLVGPAWRWDDIHFNTAGLREHAGRWADIITARIVPEPAALHLAGSGLLLGMLRRRQTRRRLNGSGSLSKVPERVNG
jgi:hypothetical protein